MQGSRIGENLKGYCIKGHQFSDALLTRTHTVTHRTLGETSDKWLLFKQSLRVLPIILQASLSL
jgi:hypothetical protein